MEDASDSDVSHPLTPSQQTFWALSEMFPESSVGNEAIVLRMRGPLDREVLRASIAELAGRSDPWQTVIRLDAESPSSPPSATRRTIEPFPVEELDLSGRAPSDLEHELAKLVDERLHTRIDLARGPLMRIVLIRCGPAEHRLLFVSHHVAFDGISFFDLLPRDLARVYSAFLRKETSPLPAAASFADFARAQQRICDEPAGESVGFWRDALAGASGAIELPVDHRRASSRGCAGLRRYSVVDPSGREALTARARELGVSLSDLLLSAFVALLHRYSGQTDLLVGVPNGNRRAPGTDGLFGCAMLTLPLRFDASGDPSVSELAQRVRATKRAAFEHVDPRVDRVLMEEVANRGCDGGSGYRVVFNYASTISGPLAFDGLEVALERPDPGWTAVDLSLDVNEGGEGLALTLEVDRDLFGAETADRCLEHYVCLLRAIAAGGDEAVSKLPLIGPVERRALTQDLNATARPYPRDVCLHELIASRAPSDPAALAAVSHGRELTYGALREEALRLAAHLRALGARPGERVALCVEDPLASLVGMLGALESGAAYVPIDVSLPPARVAWMLGACSPIAIVTERKLLDSLGDRKAPALCLDALPAEFPAWRSAGEPAQPGPEDPAYVIFTSGSTGRPKGVVVRHRNVVSQLFARIEGYPESPGRLLTAHSFAFDAAAAGIYWTLASGGTLVLPDSEQRRDPVVLRQLVAEHGVTHLDLPPALHRELLTSATEHALDSVGTVIVGGETCSPALALGHARWLPRAQLYNEYGPTETTIYSTVYAVPRDRIPDPVPIGKPIANTRCYVLDLHGEPVPQGVSGELYIGGEGVAAGYLDQPELTAERFLADPFVPDPGARMYRTGDRVRRRVDGELEYLGRADRQVKVRGNRVELGEIEAALLRCPEVAGAVAVARDESGTAQVDAYVVLGPGRPPSSAALRALLRAELPEYMVPTHVSAIASIPLTAAGKVDVERLPAPTQASEGDPRGLGFLEPRTQAEQRIAGIWMELLGLPRVGVHDDFFDLGGHSLLAVRMLSLVGAILGVRVSLSAFARLATVARLAGMLHQQGGVSEESLVVAVQPLGNRRPFWMIHPVGGHVVFAKRLAVHLDPDQPLLGIQAQGLDGHKEPLETIEEMARLYVSLIRGAQPRGPYFIGGHSLGGLLAMEIALQLEEAGERLGIVALLDAWGPTYPRRLSAPMRIVDRLRFGVRWGVRASVRAVTVDGLSEYLSYDPLASAERQDDLSDAISRVARANAKAAERYRFRFYPGKVHVFRALRTPDWPGLRFDDPLCGWGAYTREVEVIPMDCAHPEMLDEPTVTELGKRLELLLAKAQAER